MTLSTKIYVQDKVSIRAAHAKMNELAGIPETAKVREDPDGLVNEAGQGFSAWVITYGDPQEEKPYIAAGAVAVADEDSSYEPDPPCWISVSIDTGYGYQGPEGGCSDLHARLVAQFGQWLSQGDVPWCWRNEYTGEIHRQFEGIENLGRSGKKAGEWFRSDVLPANRGAHRGS
jgi:hypothetical protein